MEINNRPVQKLRPNSHSETSSNEGRDRKGLDAVLVLIVSLLIISKHYIEQFNNSNEVGRVLITNDLIRQMPEEITRNDNIDQFVKIMLEKISEKHINPEGMIIEWRLLNLREVDELKKHYSTIFNIPDNSKIYYFDIETQKDVNKEDILAFIIYNFSETGCSILRHGEGFIVVIS
jgi:hypothetical protein